MLLTWCSYSSLTEFCLLAKLGLVTKPIWNVWIYLELCSSYDSLTDVLLFCHMLCCTCVQYTLDDMLWLSPHLHVHQPPPCSCPLCETPSEGRLQGIDHSITLFSPVLHYSNTFRQKHIKHVQRRIIPHQNHSLTCSPSESKKGAFSRSLHI